MKQSFRIALRIYKYLFLIYTVIYWIWICVEGYDLIEQYGLNLDALIFWFVWYVIFLAAGSIYFWLGAFGGIVIYRKIFLRKNKLPEQ